MNVRLGEVARRQQALVEFIDEHVGHLE